MKITWEDVPLKEILKEYTKARLVDDGVYTTSSGLTVIISKDKYYTKAKDEVIQGDKCNIQCWLVKPSNHKVTLTFENE